MATSGTLTELANFSSEALGQLATGSGPTPRVAAAGPLPPFNRDIARTLLEHTLEATLILAASQLALALAQPDLDPSSRQLIHTELANELLESIARAAKATRGGVAGTPGSPTTLRRSRGSSGADEAASPLLKGLRAFVTSRVRRSGD